MQRYVHPTTPWIRLSAVVILALSLNAPTAALAQKVPPGFTVELLFQVPEIEHPSAVTCDAEGNLFVAEDPMDMRGPATEPIDRILYVRWDKEGGPPVKTVFCENLSAVFGMLWHEGALYVMNAPYYTMLKDTDGDGVADVRTQLNDTLGHSPGLFGANNHVPTGMRLGLDGLVYVALGDKGLPKAVGADGSTITLEGGGVFRMRLDATELEVVSHGIRNNMDVALDRFDNIFAYDNDDDFGWWTRLVHHVPMGYYGYPYDYRSGERRHLPPVSEHGSGTPCGGACYREATWPAEYRGNAFFCQWGESKIERFTLTKKGASFESRLETFMTGDGSGEFRPIDLCFSPDGRHMYIADWNMAGGGKETPVGRVYRVTYVGKEGKAEVSESPSDRTGHPLATHFRMLEHPAHNQRMGAQRQLVALGADAVEPIAELLRSDASTIAKVHAIWTQNALIDTLRSGKLDDDQLNGGKLEGDKPDTYDPSPDWIAALRDTDADVRSQAARALGYRRMTSAIAPLTKALQDRDAAVRMRAAYALARIGHEQSAEPLFEALEENDPFARYTMIQAIRAIGNWRPALQHLMTVNKETREAILESLRGVYDPTAVEVLHQWFTQADDPSERVIALQALALVHRQAGPYTGGWWGGKAAGGRPAREKKHAWASTPVVLAALEAALQQESPQVRVAALEALRNVPATVKLPNIRKMIRTDPDEQVRRSAIALLVQLNDRDVVDALLHVAADRAAGDPLRQDAIRGIVSLGADNDAGQNDNVDRDLLAIATRDDLSACLASTTLEAIATLNRPQASTVIRQRLDDPRAEVRARAVEACVEVRGDDLSALVAQKLDDENLLVRRASLLAIGKLGSSQHVPAMIAAAADSQVRTEALQALAAIPDRRALAFYLDGLIDEDPAIRTAAGSALKRLGSSVAKDIRSLQERRELSAPLQQELAKLFAASRPEFRFLHEGGPSKLEPAAYAKFATEHTGDPARGQRLFANTSGSGCIKCHAVGGVGASLGPNLLGVGAKHPRHELIRSVLEPSNRILSDFEMTIVETTDGKVHQGILKNHTPETIELLTSEGTVVRIRVDDVEMLETSNLSPMPSGLSDGMTLQDFADIIAYLESLKEPAAANK